MHGSKDVESDEVLAKVAAARSPVRVFRASVESRTVLPSGRRCHQNQNLFTGVTDNLVHLSNLTGTEFFDAFADVKNISAVVVRVAGR
jgi:hypothetical protein